MTKNKDKAMTKNEFKQGDRVRDKENPCRFGVITSLNHYDDPDCMVVRFDDEDERVCYVTDLEIYPDRKTAFLTELQSLLRKYDAKINYDTHCEKFEIYFCDGIYIVDSIFYPLKYDDYSCDDCMGYLNLDADNIMDFDKE